MLVTFQISDVAWAVESAIEMRRSLIDETSRRFRVNPSLAVPSPIGRGLHDKRNINGWVRGCGLSSELFPLTPTLYPMGRGRSPPSVQQVQFT
jgi:hypothetical protein